MHIQSFRLPDDLRKRALKVLKVGPYRITLSQLILRGLELAIKELETKK